MIRPVSPEELTRLIEQRDTGGDQERGSLIHVFDLRDASAFAQGHVPGARHVPRSHALRWIPQRALTQETVILVDADGARHGDARHVAHDLAHRWFRRVRYLEGGFAAYKDAGHAVKQGGPTGPGADSFDGTREAYQSSGEVPWLTPENPGTPDPTRSR